MPFDPLLLQAAELLRARKTTNAIEPPANVLEWSKRYRRLEGQAFSLDRFRPLEALYTDDHPNIVVKKPAQRGVSEYAVSFVCFALEHGARLWSNGLRNGLNVGYLFPVKQDLEDFAKERINELRDESAHLASLFSDEQFDSLGFKRVGNSHLYMRGTYAKSGLLSFPADALVFDEFDQMDPKSVSLALRRMNASPVRRQIKISTPTFPGRGISSAYLASDQRIYQTPCTYCGEYVSFDFFRDSRCDDEPYEAWKHWSQDRIGVATVTVHCPSCDKALDTAARCAPGRWFVQNPEFKRVHGYHVPWWAFPMVDEDRLVEYAISAVSDEPTEIEELYRSDLGLEYGSGSGAVTEEMIKQLSAEYPTDLSSVGWRNTTLGCDIGARLHYRISSEDRLGRVCVREMGALSDRPGYSAWDQLDERMTRFQVRLAVIDAEPELHESINFCARWPGRARRAFYPTRATSLKGTLLHEPKDDTTKVNVNRTMAMDLVMANIANMRELWPRDVTHDPEVLEHMTAPTRVQVADQDGQNHYVWIHTKPDHGFHASVYDTIARRLLPKSDDPPPSVGGERTIMSDYARLVTSELPIEKLRSGRRQFV